ncbi:hypothetical protein BB560_005095 [Smittium megazygosporum]|uniref:Thiolase N-terminal domain-containing protein n=1 Tax=Smittium megazygosporum TaxID=133381 RepID=A0A2T9Z7J7_9FUNG|nr:hypothetical protein BB560_005095 [Smittium megazygosporum]
MSVYIASAVRTPIGSFNGVLKSLSATKLGAVAIKGALERANIAGDAVNEVYMGQVLQGGEGQAPTTQAILEAGIPTSVPATTINKVCASGMKSIMLASQNIQLGFASVMVAGGMESMSNTPFMVPRNLGFGNQVMKDLLVHDGLTDPGTGWLMGLCTEEVIAKHKITREMQDEFATRSYKLAQLSILEGSFIDETVPVKIQGRKGDATIISVDEEPAKARFEKFAQLRPAFSKTGTITPANASKLSDGASAVVLVGHDLVEANGGSIKPLAKIISYADANTDPIAFSLAPVLGIPKALERANLSIKEIAAWEINEAFSAVPLLAHKILDIPIEKINTKGGAVAMGHPLGSSGSRIVATLLHSLKPGEYGCAAICNGGGGSSALVIQRL